MRMTKDSKGEQVHAFVFTGDGRTEFRHLSAICKKLDGTTKVLWFPESPIPLKREKDTGLYSLRNLRQITMEYRQRRLLLAIDREHFGTEAQRSGKELDEAKDFLQKRIRATVADASVLMPQNAFLLRCSFGSQSFDLCLAIRETHEKEIAQLIQFKFHTKIEPVDSQIRSFLKKIKMDEETLIEKCAAKYLAQAFPGLYCALSWIEEQQ